MIPDHSCLGGSTVFYFNCNSWQKFIPIMLWINVNLLYIHSMIWIIGPFWRIKVLCQTIGLWFLKKKTWSTPWFISNGTVKILICQQMLMYWQKNYMAGNIWNHRMYSYMNFNSLIFFQYQYWCLFRQDQRAKYMHLKSSSDHHISWNFSKITNYFCIKMFFRICRFSLCLAFEMIIQS